MPARVCGFFEIAGCRVGLHPMAYRRLQVHDPIVLIVAQLMKQNKLLRNQTKELARAAQTFAAAGFLPNPATLASSVESDKKSSCSSLNLSPMSLREMQRWLDAEAAVIARHESARLDGFHSPPT